MDWSKYQLGVFDFAQNETGHGCVQAVAGSGKSTTGIEMICRFNPMDQGLFSTFTRVIINDAADRIQKKGLRNVKAQNYNSFGNGLIRSYMRPFPKLLTAYQGQKTDQILKYDIKPDNYYKVKNVIIRMVSLFKNLALTEISEADRRYEEILEYYDVDEPRVKGFKQIFLDTYKRNMERTDIMDFDDQKFFPVLFDWPAPQFDFLVLDEFQDSCPVEVKLMFRACQGGRIIVFGDSNQAIYSFKGTTADSMNQFQVQMGAKKLPLSVCYRCSEEVVKEAKKIVPEIEWGPKAIKGFVGQVKLDWANKQVQQGDFVLARVTEDLVKSVLNFIEDGRAAYVEGSEYANMLGYYIEKTNPDGNDDIMVFKTAVEEHFNEVYPDLLAHNKDRQAQILESKKETIEVLMVGCSGVQKLRDRIKTIFTDSGNGIRHLTIHKAKGLETKNVFVLRPDKIPHKRARSEHHQAEEMRLKYVAITRAMENLFYVQG